jgi:hypothetical protein
LSKRIALGMSFTTATLKCTAIPIKIRTLPASVNL